MRRTQYAAIGIALFAVGGALHAQQDEVRAVKEANQTFYKALSARDLKAMQAVWANQPYVVNIGPRSKAPAVGYEEAVAKYWSNAFNVTFSKIEAEIVAVTQVQTNGKLAWVSGVEKASLHLKSGGNPINIENLVTNIFEKEGDRWLMVVHHAQVVPK